MANSTMNITFDEKLKEKNYWKKSHFNVGTILPAYGILLTVCLVGNVLVCVTIIRNKRMRSRWYFLLMNLSIADMGFAITTPIQLLQFVNVDIGDIGCKSGIFILDIFLGTALLTLAFISIDRYHGICKPDLRPGQSRVKSRFIIGLIWLAATVSYFPMTFACKRSSKPGSLSCDCHSAWPKAIYYAAYSMYVTCMIYVIPFTSMLFCYYKICNKLWRSGTENSLLPSDPTGTKRKGIKMLIVTTLIFLFAWTPYNCLFVLKKFDLIQPKLLGKSFLIAQILGFANSACNPFIYCIFSKNFRNGFKVICCWRRRERARDSFSGQKSVRNQKIKVGRSRTDTGLGSSIVSSEGRQ